MKKERKSSKEYRGVIGALCIMLVMFLLTGVGGYTYAKYISQEKGTGNADIANWSFKIAKSGEETKNVTLRNTANKATLVNGKIAPGTSGEFSITLDATGSDVSVDYTLEFSSEINKPANIIFTYNGKEYKSLTEIGRIKGNIAIGNEMTKTIPIKWTWAYQTGSTDEAKNENDIKDTNNGTSLLDYSFNMIATGVQAQ